LVPRADISEVAGISGKFWYGCLAYLYNYSATVLLVCQELHEQGHATKRG